MRQFKLFKVFSTTDLDDIIKAAYTNYSKNYSNLKQNNKSNSIKFKIKNNILAIITSIIDKFIDDLLLKNYMFYNKNDNSIIVIFDLDTQLKYNNSSKELIFEKITKSIEEKEESKSIDKQDCQEELTYSFTIVELYTNTDYSSIIFYLFIIFLLIYNYFHNTNIIIFSNINFLIFYTTFRHTLFKIMGGNCKKTR